MAFVDRMRSFSRQAFAARSESLNVLGADYVLFLAAAGMVAALPLLFVWQSPAEFWNEGRWAFIGSLFIFLFFSILALFVTFRTLLAYSREQSVAATVFARVKSDLAKLDADDEALRPSDIEPVHYIPNGEKESASAKLVEKHFDTARALRSDDGIAALVITNDLSFGRGSLRILSAFALRIGILLTFFGLLVGLAPIGAALESSEDLAEVPIGELLSGLTISFTSSIAGLAAALVIGVLLQATERSFSRLRGTIDDLALALRQVYSRVRFGGDLSKTVDHLTEEMRNHAREMESHGVQVERSVDQAARAFREHAEESGRIMQGVARSTDDLVQLESQHRDAVAQISESVSSLGQFEKNWTGYVDTLVNRSSSSLKEHADTLTTSFTGHFDTLQKKIAETQASQTEEMQDVLTSLSKTTQSVSETLSSVSASQSSTDSEISRALMKLNTSINGLEAQSKRSGSGWFLKFFVLVALALWIYLGWPYIQENILPLLPPEIQSTLGLI